LGGPAPHLPKRIGGHAESVFRHYLSNGHRAGAYWLVGDVDNTPGRSLYVRLEGVGSGPRAAGKWTDAATGQHGDLLDLIAANCRLDRLTDVLDEARRFLALPCPERIGQLPRPRPRRGSPETARRLFAMSRPITGTAAEVYLRERGITELRNCASLRFHPRCFYRGEADELLAWPALIAGVTDLSGRLTGVLRTWLDPTGASKAPVSTPRRAMGHLLGHGVRFGLASEVMVAGEGIETMLSLRSVLPTLPAVAALSANHLAALELPTTLRRLYLARDGDPAGRRAAASLADKARSSGIETLTLDPILGDFNDDLRCLGGEALAAAVRVQLAPEDVMAFLALEAADQAGGRRARRDREVSAGANGLASAAPRAF
jgi:hypothetical protein